MNVRFGLWRTITNMATPLDATTTTTTTIAPTSTDNDNNNASTNDIKLDVRAIKSKIDLLLDVCDVASAVDLIKQTISLFLQQNIAMKKKINANSNKNKNNDGPEDENKDDKHHHHQQQQENKSTGVKLQAADIIQSLACRFVSSFVCLLFGLLCLYFNMLLLLFQLFSLLLLLQIYQRSSCCGVSIGSIGRIRCNNNVIIKNNYTRTTTR